MLSCATTWLPDRHITALTTRAVMLGAAPSAMIGVMSFNFAGPLADRLAITPTADTWIKREGRGESLPENGGIARLPTPAAVSRIAPPRPHRIGATHIGQEAQKKGNFGVGDSPVGAVYN